MANLKELRIRINSVKTTKQITSAMKMVAAAKLRKAQQAILQLRPYAEKIHHLLESVVANAYDPIESDFFVERPIKNVLLIAITSNRGLCGAFNSNVEKKIVSMVNEYKKDGISVENLKFIAYGKKGADALNRRGYNLIEKNTEVFDNLTYEYATKISEDIKERYLNKEFDKVEIVYNSFKNAATQEIVKEQFLPLVQDDSNFSSTGDYLYEPDFEKVLEKLIPEALTMQIYKALLDSSASEQGARMTAMHKATDNATELIHDLNLIYNKARQAAITTEIIEIVSGAEALKG